MTKRIQFNRDTKDFDCFVAIDGGAEQYIGSRATYSQAEVTINEYVLAYFEDTSTPEVVAQLILANAYAGYGVTR